MASSVDDLKSPYFWRAIFAEALGTALLVFVGCGSCLSFKDNQGSLDDKIVKIALVFGLAVATAVWAIAHISGGHINPAVSIAMLVTRRISLIRAVLYVLMQVTGAICGAGILAAVTPDAVRNRSGGLGETTFNPEQVSPGMAFSIELLITFILVLTVFATTDSKRTDLSGSGPLAIGLSVTLCHLAFIPFTGSSMNPARSLGPVAITKKFDNHWLYWIAPILGGILAGILYETSFAANASWRRTRAYLLATTYEKDKYESTLKKDKTMLSDLEIGVEDHAECVA